MGSPHGLTLWPSVVGELGSQQQRSEFAEILQTHSIDHSSELEIKKYANSVGCNVYD